MGLSVPTPSPSLEGDITAAAAYERHVTCTAGARPGELYGAYRESWRWSRELFDTPATTDTAREAL